jgi:hypothetical protein
MAAMRRLALTLTLCSALACGSGDPQPGADAGVTPDAGTTKPCTPDPGMSFFVTAQGSLSGDLGGLAGADARCGQLAAAAGISGKTWVAYLSAEADATFGRVDAKDRVGPGPWRNAAGEPVGDLAAIHAAGIAKALILTECGDAIRYSAADPASDASAHDVFTGSTAEGTLEREVNPNTGLRDGAAATCGDWTSASPDDSAMVGHTDHQTAEDGWNWAHYTLGCHLAGLRMTAANGRFYCFARE